MAFYCSILRTGDILLYNVKKCKIENASKIDLSVRTFYIKRVTIHEKARNIS